MIPNCLGCQEEYYFLIEILKENPNLHFAGQGLYEKGHLFIRLVNDKGEIVIQ